MELELEMLPEQPIDTARGRSGARAGAEDALASAVAARAQAEQRAECWPTPRRAPSSRYDAIAELAAEVAVIERLAHTVSGRAPNTRRMKLETFVLAAELEEIVAAANVRLGEMSGERYSLQHSDALAARGRRQRARARGDGPLHRTRPARRSRSPAARRSWRRSPWRSGWPRS